MIKIKSIINNLHSFAIIILQTKLQNTRTIIIQSVKALERSVFIFAYWISPNRNDGLIRVSVSTDIHLKLEP